MRDSEFSLGSKERNLKIMKRERNSSFHSVFAIRLFLFLLHICFDPKNSHKQIEIIKNNFDIFTLTISEYLKKFWILSVKSYAVYRWYGYKNPTSSDLNWSRPGENLILPIVKKQPLSFMLTPLSYFMV